MATLDEVRDALSVLAFGYAYRPEPPAAASISRLWPGSRSSWSRAVLARKVTLLHCTTDYPHRSRQ